MFFFLTFAVLLVASCSAQQSVCSVEHAAQQSKCTPQQDGCSTQQNSACPRRNGYFKCDTLCDTYVECREFKAHRMMCPDGLNFNPNIQWPEYPCSYPSDYYCPSARYQQPIPTGECPQQYGFFPHPDATEVNCAPYKMCVAGVATDMKCAAGLAFNPDSGRCEWADLVPYCDVKQYLGFECPPTPLDADGEPLDIVLNYKYPGVNCTSFFSCDHGRARFLSCDLGMLFDDNIGRCRDADLVCCTS